MKLINVDNRIADLLIDGIVTPSKFKIILLILYRRPEITRYELYELYSESIVKKALRKMIIAKMIAPIESSSLRDKFDEKYKHLPVSGWDLSVFHIDDRELTYHYGDSSSLDVQNGLGR